MAFALKGGVLLSWARWEEIEELIEEGVPFEVVPGVPTAAAGCAAYAASFDHRD